MTGKAGLSQHGLRREILPSIRELLDGVGALTTGSGARS